MNIKLYQNSSEVNRVTKSDYLTLKYNLDGNLRAECNLLDPVIEVASDTPLFDINYCYIEDFNRYYFVDNVDIVITGLYRLKLSVDVLFTYSSELRSLNAFVTRNEYEYNKSIVDTKMPFKSIPTIYINKPETLYAPETDVQHWNYYEKNYLKIKSSPSSQDNVIIMSHNDFVNTVPIGYLNNGQVLNIGGEYQRITGFATQYNKYSKLNVLSSLEFNNIISVVKNDDNKASHIYKVIKFPFNMSLFYGASESLYLGDTQILEDQTFGYVALPAKWTVLKHFKLIDDNIIDGEESFIHYTDKTNIELYLPFNKWISLNSVDCYNRYLTILYQLDLFTGQCLIRIISSSEEFCDGDCREVFSDTCQIGVELPVNTTNQREILDNYVKNTLNTIMGVGVSAVGIATVNPMIIAGGGGLVTKSIADMSLQHQKATGNVGSGGSSVYGYNDVIFRLSTFEPTLETDEEWSEYCRLYGRPLNETKLLSDLTGYTEIGEIHLENLNATKEEITRLQNILNSGGIIL